ncbi:lysylphosphatidylglycerol synthetase [Brucella neotomae]|nr:lysylphosphatidylglycerol synthetase [Brucella neotomae]
MWALPRPALCAVAGRGCAKLRRLCARLCHRHRAGIASHAPGGLGAFEATIIAGLGLGGKPDAIAGLLAYRLIYTVLPLVVATAGILIWEVMRRRHMLDKQARFAKRLVEPLVPGLSASIIFLGGIILLSQRHARYALSCEVAVRHRAGISCGMSHLAASLVGVALLIVARGLSKRLERAWVAAMVLLLCGAVFSIAKGLTGKASILCLLPFHSGAFAIPSTVVRLPARLN